MYQSWHLFEVILNCSIFICDLFYCPHLSWLLKREDHSTRCYSFLCNKHEQRKFRSVLSLYAMLWKLCVHSDFWVHCGLVGTPECWAARKTPCSWFPGVLFDQSNSTLSNVHPTWRELVNCMILYFAWGGSPPFVFMLFILCTDPC